MMVSYGRSLFICLLLLLSLSGHGSAGGGPHCPDDFAADALVQAAMAGDLELTRCLIGKNANLNALRKRNQDTPIGVAADRGHVEIVEALIESGAEINRQNRNGYSPLLNAVTEGHHKIAMALVSAGADLELRDSGGYTALLHAAFHGYEQIVRSLLDRGAYIDAQDKNGETPLLKGVN